jgi:hypothetical protein
MASTVQRSSGKSGLVLLESDVEVAEDGFVKITSKFLAPTAGLGVSDFLLDSVWPMSALPAATPSIQAGPFLSSRTMQKKNGLLYVDAVYVSALNPVRISTSYSDSIGRFSGYEPPVQVGLTYTETAALLSFDYVARAVSKSFAVIGDNAVLPGVAGSVISRFNVVSAGNAKRVTTKVQQVVTSKIDEIGLVKRFTITATPTVIQTGRTAQILGVINAAGSFS